mgnify:FL=1
MTRNEQDGQKLFGSKFRSYQIGQQLDLAVGKLVAKRQHSVPTFGDLFVYLCLGFEFKFARAQARNDRPVIARLVFTVSGATDRGVLEVKRC